MPAPAPPPAASVVISDFGPPAPIARTLEALSAQNRSDFEVIVSAVGTDDAETADAFADRLEVSRVSPARRRLRMPSPRTEGSRAARGPILVFLAAGSVPGPDFVDSHIEAHAAAEPRAVIGYVYGNRPWGVPPGLAERLAEEGPERAVAGYEADRRCLDLRHETLAEADFDPSRKEAPWLYFWAGNCSVRAEDFGAAGGFDGDFGSPFIESVEFGLRLRRHGARFAMTRDGWTVSAPHGEREAPSGSANRADARLFLRRHPDPVGELMWWAIGEDFYRSMEHELRSLARRTAEADPTGVREELEAELAPLSAPAERIAVLGCGDAIPEALRGAELFDFDRGAVDRLVEAGHRSVHHAIGVRTPLRAGSVDHVVITSRLRGLWDRWSDEVLAEAERIGGRLGGPLAPRSRTGAALKGA